MTVESNQKVIYEMAAWKLRAEVAQERLVAAEVREAQLREALAYVRDWIRDGEGDEATAAELMDAALVVQPPEQGRKEALSRAAHVMTSRPWADDLRQQAEWLLHHWTEPAFVRPKMQEASLDLARSVLAVVQPPDTREGEAPC